MPDVVSRIHNAIAPRKGELPWRARARARLAKRVLDIAIATPATIAALPVIGAVALAVRATSRGPVLFRQQRIGLDGELFTLWKFRTMRADRPDGSATGFSEVTRSDSRLTSIGAFLRDSRLDELPQLFQVLTGRMSLVGPRPDVPANLAAYDDASLLRFAMPPGCTAWTFTRGAFENDWATRQAINVEYVRQWNVWLDLRILAGTALVLLTRKATSPTVAEVPGKP
ncbi:MAG: sugar transferase [Deltaproteobacteria bacterium]|nr:sugar transferase [Deltaproteobacteria bacterium]